MCALFLPVAGYGYVLVVDIDALTPGPGMGAPGATAASGLPPTAGPPDSIDTSAFVTSGTTLTMVVYLMKAPGPPLPAFSSVGADLNWGAAGDTATLTPVPGSLLAGGFAGNGATPLPGSSEDFFAPGTFLTIGGPLTPGPAPPVAGFASNFGGVGYSDSSFLPAGAFFSGFGSAGGFAPGVLAPLDGDRSFWHHLHRDGVSGGHGDGRSLGNIRAGRRWFGPERLRFDRCDVPGRGSHPPITFPEP